VLSPLVGARCRGRPGAATGRWRAGQPIVIAIEYAPKSPKGTVMNRLDGSTLTHWGTCTPVNGSMGGATAARSHLSLSLSRVSMRFGQESKNEG
jgi:hypothetical protein